MLLGEDVHQGCQFHQAQAVIKQLGKAKPSLKGVYNRNASLRASVNELISMSNLPPKDVPEMFNALRDEMLSKYTDPEFAGLTSFLNDYFQHVSLYRLSTMCTISLINVCLDVDSLEERRPSALQDLILVRT
jgi:hypothetical protein